MRSEDGFRCVRNIRPIEAWSADVVNHCWSPIQAQSIQDLLVQVYAQAWAFRCADGAVSVVE